MPDLNSTESPSEYRWAILAISTFSFVGSSALQLVPAAIAPVINNDLHLSRTAFGVLASSLFAGMFLATMPAGYLIDRYGERFVVAAGLSAMAVLAMLASFTSSYPALVALLVLASLGGAVSGPGGAKLIASWFPPRQRGIALGVRQGGGPIGGFLVALALPPLAIQFGWGAAFRIAAAFCLLGALTFAFGVREAGTELQGSSASATDSRKVNHTFSRTVNHTLLFITASCFVLAFVQGACTAYLVLYLHDSEHLTLVTAGAVFAVFLLGGLFGRVLWGGVADRLGPGLPRVALTVIAAAACVAMASLPKSSPAAAGIVAAGLGLSAYGWTALFVGLIIDAGPADRAASRIGFSMTFALPGIVIAPPVFGFVVDHTSYTTAWRGLALWACLGLIVHGLGRLTANRRHQHSANDLRTQSADH